MENEGFSKQNTSSNGTVYFRCRLRARFGCNALMKISPNNMPGQHNWRMYRLSRHHHIPANERFQRGLPEHVKGVLYPSPILLSPNYPQPCTTSPVYPPPHTHTSYTTQPYTTQPYTIQPYTTQPYTTQPYTTQPCTTHLPLTNGVLRIHPRSSERFNGFEPELNGYPAFTIASSNSVPTSHRSCSPSNCKLDASYQATDGACLYG